MQQYQIKSNQIKSIDIYIYIYIYLMMMMIMMMLLLMLMTTTVTMPDIIYIHFCIRHRAASLGHIGVVKILIAAKARVNIRDQVANTPLHLACEEGHGDTALLLIQHGARADQPNREGKTALDLCDAMFRAYLESQID
ncbi:ankyrin repeat-containing domain protein [Phycomyces blakesleeanus]|uniref:Ankyrin repeat-containing domain protein n=1 Tax=Phycomyces blakesleeanus TaxID=4837 RepID=A0ABR3ARL1_PHYBL